MKRKFLMICMLFTMSVSMIACADGSDSSKEEEIREENEKEEDESREEGFIMQKLAAWTGHEVTMTDSNLEDATEEGLAGESVTSDESLDTDAMVEESDKVDNNGLDVDIVNPVFYDENGITITFQGFNEENRLRIRVDNSNPNNQEVYFTMHHFAIDNMAGYAIVPCTWFKIEGEAGPVASGDSGVYKVAYDMINYMLEDEYNMLYERECEKLGITDKQFQTLSLCYNIKIGSENSGEERCSVLRTSEYEEGYLESFYGEYVTSIEIATGMLEYAESQYTSDDFEFDVTKDLQVNMDNKALVEVYMKQTDIGVVVVLKNTDEEFITASAPSFYINEEYADDLAGIENVDTLMLLGNGGIGVYEFRGTADEIRKSLEIPNDVALELSLRFRDYRYYSGERIIIPVKTIE